MSMLTFTLHKKTLTVSARDSMFTEKLSFEARLPKRDSFSTHEGKQVKTGYVELVFEKPEYETEKIHFIDALEAIDTGSIYPLSISLYAKVTTDVFALIRDSNPNTLLSLRLQTEMMGLFNSMSPWEKQSLEYSPNKT